MKEIIERERAKLQALFEPFNRQGSFMRVRDGDWKAELGLVDSFTVTRLAPDFDAAGNLRKVAFWLLWKAVGYDEDGRHTHTIKVVSWSQDDTFELDFVNDDGWEHHVELALPGTEPQLVEVWARWQKYRAANREMFGRLDAELLEMHQEIAETWGAAGDRPA